MPNIFRFSNAWLSWFGALALLAFLAGLSACSDPKLAFKGVDITGTDYAKELNLPDQNGQVRKLKDFSGKLVVVFFGYTQCPDVCPTSMAELVEVKKALGAQAHLLQGIFVSVDPERDTQEVLKAYMANFDASFVALRPEAEQLAALTRDYKVYAKKVPGTQPGFYTVDHSAGSYVYDPQGRVRLYARYGSGAPALAQDILVLLR